MKALIVLGGDAPGAALLRRCAEAADVTIAADKGLAAFDAAGVKPDLLIGDMDSVPKAVLGKYENDVSVRRLNCIKDDTDGFDALEVAVDRGATEITFLGALGGRLDHAMVNVMLLIRAAQRGVYAELLDERVRIIRVNGRAELHGAKGDTVSLIPMGEARNVSISGFFYPLSCYTLKNDTSLGISNVVTEDEAVVECAGGDLILFHYYGGL